MSIRKLKASQVEDVRKQLVAKQRGLCAICARPFTKKDGDVLDHDHTTGFIRGAIHRSCNGVEGRVKTLAYRSHTGVSPEDYIIGLGKYLEHHETPKYPLIHPQHMTEDDKRLKRNAKARKSRAAKKAKK